jgi:hypothetical protein
MSDVAVKWMPSWSGVEAGVGVQPPGRSCKGMAPQVRRWGRSVKASSCLMQLHRQVCNCVDGSWEHCSLLEPATYCVLWPPQNRRYFILLSIVSREAAYCLVWPSCNVLNFLHPTAHGTISPVLFSILFTILEVPLLLLAGPNGFPLSMCDVPTFGRLRKRGLLGFFF